MSRGQDNRGANDQDCELGCQMLVAQQSRGADHPDRQDPLRDGLRPHEGIWLRGALSLLVQLFATEAADP